LKILKSENPKIQISKNPKSNNTHAIDPFVIQDPSVNQDSFVRSHFGSRFSAFLQASFTSVHKILAKALKATKAIKAMKVMKKKKAMKAMKATAPAKAMKVMKKKKAMKRATKAAAAPAKG
jgi:hypothetical protein